MSVHDMWRGRRTGPGKRWEVRWRQDGAQRKRRFTEKAPAELFDVQQRLEPGDLRAEQGRTLTVKVMMDRWLSTKGGDLRSTTLTAYTLDASHVVLAFGPRLASSLMTSEIQAWGNRIHPGASIRRRSMVALRAAYKLAMADGLLVTSPAAVGRLPKPKKGKHRYLTWAELQRLADAAGQYGPLIWVLGTCGLRLEEALALNAEDIDRGRRRLIIRESKWHDEEREVPIMSPVLAMLPDHDGAVFISERARVRLNGHNWRERGFKDAVVAAGLDSPGPSQDDAAQVAPHGCIAGDRLGRQRQGRAADAGAQVGGDDARHLRPPLRRRPRHAGRPDGRSQHEGAPRAH